MKSTKTVMLSAIGGGVGLLIFSFATFGFFADSPVDVARDVLARSEFNHIKNAVILPSSFLEKEETSVFTRRFSTNDDNLFVCSISKIQFTKLNELKKTESVSISIQNRDIQTILISGDENFDSVTQILESEPLEICEGAQLKRFFYIDSPMTISG